MTPHRHRIEQKEDKPQQSLGNGGQNTYLSSRSFKFIYMHSLFYRRGNLMEDIIICQGVLAHICVHATEATLVTGGQTQQHQ